MRVFLDTNVLVDFCIERQPFFEDAARIISMLEEGRFTAYASSVTYINIAYVLRKFFDRDKVIDKLAAMLRLCSVSSIDEEIVRRAIDLRDVDFEDTVQYLSAENVQADIIITRDEKGFKQATLPVFTPKEFLMACCYSG